MGFVKDYKLPCRVNKSWYLVILVQYRAALVDTWWYWVSIGRCWLVLGGTGSVWGGTGSLGLNAVWNFSENSSVLVVGHWAI